MLELENKENVISLGYFCSIASELERLGLRNASYPFDWCISDFEGVINAISNGFKDFLSYEYLSQNKKYRSIYMNDIYKIKFFHDFDKYSGLDKQLPDVKKKYARRIERFYYDIKKPTLFIRYISDEICNEYGKSLELEYIESNYDKIISLIKSFNKNNEIIFIANNGTNSNRIHIYNVEKDNNDLVARKPLDKNKELFDLLNGIDLSNRAVNIERYNNKVKNNKINMFIRKVRKALKMIFLKEYVHTKQFE